MSGKASVRAWGLGLLAAAGSAVSAQEENRSDVFCRVVSASRTNIQSEDGYAPALIEIAGSLCDVTEDPTVIDLNLLVRDVATAQAEAVAEVVTECSGVGTATLSVEARRRAEARATAVGRATAAIIGDANICGSCKIVQDAFAQAVETITANAIAEIDLDAEFTFTGEPLTKRFVAEAVETRVAELLSGIVGELRLSARDGCRLSASIITTTPSRFATCDVSITAEDISTQTNATVRAGLEVQAFGCDGVDSFQRVRQTLREVGVAVAESVTEVDALCEARGPDTVACVVTNSTITSIAQAHVEAFAQGSAEASGEECGCNIAPVLRSREEVGAAIAESTASTFFELCAEGDGRASLTITVNALSEMVTEALAEVFIEVFVGVEECAVNLGIVVDIGPISAPSQPAMADAQM